MRGSIRNRLVILACWAAIVLCAAAVSADGDEQPRIGDELDQLKSDDWGHRVTAAIRLGRAKAVVAIPHLVAALGEEAALSPQQLKERGWTTEPDAQDYDVVSGRLRRAYQYSLIRIGPSAEPTVRIALQGAPELLAEHLWVLLGAYHQPDALEPLLRLLKNHADPYVRADAAAALGEVGAVEAIPALRAALDDPFVQVDGDVKIPLVREAARYALHQLGVDIPAREAP